MEPLELVLDKIVHSFNSLAFRPLHSRQYNCSVISLANFRLKNSVGDSHCTRMPFHSKTSMCASCRSYMYLVKSRRRRWEQCGRCRRLRNDNLRCPYCGNQNESFVRNALSLGSAFTVAAAATVFVCSARKWKTLCKIFLRKSCHSHVY